MKIIHLSKKIETVLNGPLPIYSVMFVFMKPWYKHPVISNLIRTIITGALIWLVSKRVNLQEIADIFLKASPGWLVLAIFIYISSLLLSSHRSALYLSSIGIHLSPFAALGLYMKGTVYNVLLPGGIGGDGYKILVLRTNGGPSVKQIFQAFFFERLSGLWAIISLLCVLNATLNTPLLPPMWLWMILVLGTAAYYLIMRKFFAEHSVFFARTHLISLTIQGLVSVSVLCILQSQPLPFEFRSYLMSFHGSTIFSILNIGLSGLGVREFAMGYAANMLQNDPALSVFVASAFWLVSTISAIPGIGFLLMKGEKKVADPIA